MGACGSKPATPSAVRASTVTSTNKRDAANRSGSPGHSNGHSKKGPPEFGIEEHYEVLSLLGQGGTGQTWLCKDKKSGEEVAVKLIRRPIPKPVVPMIMHEIKIQGDLGEGHLNIVNAKEVLLTHSHLALVMEYASGGTLTSYVSNRWETTKERGGLFLSEDEARYFMMQFLSAVEYCHANHVAHRDLKLDNTLLDNSTPPRIKICDFGFAKNWDEQANMFTQIGTPVYMSPQLITSKNGKAGYDGRKADVWASGVLLFVMLLGMFPFEHAEHPDPNTSAAHIEVWLQQIRSSWRENPRVKEVAGRLSPQCRDLLDKIFDLDEGSRLDIEGIKNHPWWVMPLPPHLAEALEGLQVEQDTIDQTVSSGSLKSPDRDFALENMMTLSSRPPIPGEPISRISLTRLQRAYTLADPNLLQSIMEDHSFHGGRHHSSSGSLQGSASGSVSSSSLSGSMSGKYMNGYTPCSALFRESPVAAAPPVAGALVQAS